MFKINKDMEYALISIQEINNHEKPVPVRLIAQKYKLPYEILSKILQKLGSKKILQSTHGPKGGYTMVSSLESISLLKLFKALQGEIHIVSCIEKESNCVRTDSCTMQKSMVNMQTLLTSFFDSISIRDFLDMGKMDEVEEEFTFTGNIPYPLVPERVLEKGGVHGN